MIRVLTRPLQQLQRLLALQLQRHHRLCHHLLALVPRCCLHRGWSTRTPLVDCRTSITPAPTRPAGPSLWARLRMVWGISGWICVCVCVCVCVCKLKLVAYNRLCTNRSHFSIQLPLRSPIPSRPPLLQRHHRLVSPLTPRHRHPRLALPLQPQQRQHHQQQQQQQQRVPLHHRSSHLKCTRSGRNCLIQCPRTDTSTTR